MFKNTNFINYTFGKENYNHFFNDFPLEMILTTIVFLAFVLEMIISLVNYGVGNYVGK